MAKNSTGSPATSRQAKIQAAQKSGGGGANKIVVATVVVVVAIVAVVAGVVWSESKKQAAVGTSTATPPGTSMGEGYRVYPDATLVSGAPVVDVYEDFQCPICAQFEAAMGPTVEGLAQQGKIELRYHVLNFLDDKTGAQNSTPAANGAFCAAADGKFLDFHNAVYADQAPEGQDVAQARLDSWAASAGITGPALTTWKQCVADGTYTKYVSSVNDAAFKLSGFQGTPTIAINGTIQDTAKIATPDAFTQAVTAATK